MRTWSVLSPHGRKVLWVGSLLAPANLCYFTSLCCSFSLGKPLSCNVFCSQGNWHLWLFPFWVVPGGRYLPSDRSPGALNEISRVYKMEQWCPCNTAEGYPFDGAVGPLRICILFILSWINITQIQYWYFLSINSAESDSIIWFGYWYLDPNKSQNYLTFIQNAFVE